MVETGGLENRFALTGNGGSNPSPSATLLLRNAWTLPALQNPGVFGAVWRIILVAESASRPLSKPPV